MHLAQLGWWTPPRSLGLPLALDLLLFILAVMGGRVMTAVAEQPAAGEGLILPPVRKDDPGRIFAIFIDDRHIQPGDSPKTRVLLQKIRDTLLHDGDLVTMVSTGKRSCGGVSMVLISRAPVSAR